MSVQPYVYGLRGLPGQPPDLVVQVVPLADHERAVAEARDDERAKQYADPDRDPVAAHNRGYAAALSAAIDAVKALPVAPVNEMRRYRRDAVATIEALKEKP